MMFKVIISAETPGLLAVELTSKTDDVTARLSLLGSTGIIINPSFVSPRAAASFITLHPSAPLAFLEQSQPNIKSGSLLFVFVLMMTGIVFHCSPKAWSTGTGKRHCYRCVYHFTTDQPVRPMQLEFNRLTI